MARAGVAVDLAIRRSDDRTDDECLEFYGLTEHPNLNLRRVAVPLAAKLPGQIVFAATMLLRGTDRYDALYTRDLLLADICLRTKFWHRLPVIYEAHTSAATFAEEAPRLYSTYPASSRGKLERLRRRERKVYQGVSRLVTITEALREFLEDRFGPLAPVAVVPDGARLPEESSPLPSRLDGESLRITYIGQLYPWKGVDTLLLAMKELVEHELTIVGGLPPEPDLERTRKLARDLGVSDRVSFRGYLPPTQLDAERQVADVFVIPLADSTMSRHFTSPLKLFEAMAAGRPVVASDFPSIREVLTDGVNALLVPPGDPAALARAIRTLAADGTLRTRLAERARQDIQRYSWDERGRRIAAILRDVVSPAEDKGRLP
jgi:glycosyltransferase involved in cell wall biosynthesis